MKTILEIKEKVSKSKNKSTLKIYKPIVKGANYREMKVTDKDNFTEGSEKYYPEATFSLEECGIKTFYRFQNKYRLESRAQANDIFLDNSGMLCNVTGFVFSDNIINSLKENNLLM